MALAGDEKKIRALFSELALQDQSAAPAFAELWLNAAIKDPAPVRGLSTPLLVISAALLIAASGMWSWYRFTRSAPEQAVHVSPQPISTSSLQLAQEPKHVTTDDASPRYRQGRQNKQRIRPLERPGTEQAALLSRWQSPTQLLMKSPAAVDLNSVPQLNQSVEKLKQFLPRNTEQTKESNQ